MTVIGKCSGLARQKEKQLSKKLIITNYQNRLITALYENKDLIQVNFEEEEKQLLGNIYIGKVQNIVKNINAAFVEIAPGVMGYLSLNDATQPIFTKWNNNSQKVKIGDELVVQVSRDAVKTKASVVTADITIAGKYIVLVHGRKQVGVSCKIFGEEIRNRLKEMVSSYQTEDYSFVVRTNAEFADANTIIKEAEGLAKIYENIRKYGVHRTRFTLLYQNPPGYICDIRDHLSESIDEIITDVPEVYDTIKNYLEAFQPEDIQKLRFYDDKMISVSNLYSLSSKIEQALKQHIWLKSGGSIVIQPTEALTVIDVNTEKAIGGKKDVQETFFKVNMEAAHEIAKQIRLRNLSGIIIIDFIDLRERSKKDQLMKELQILFREDPVKTILVDMTALGLVEVTRKKIKRPLHEQIQRNMYEKK